MKDKILPEVLRKLENKVPKRVASKWLELFIPEYKKQYERRRNGRFKKGQDYQFIAAPALLLMEGAEEFIESLTLWAELGDFGAGLEAVAGEFPFEGGLNFNLAEVGGSVELEDVGFISLENAKELALNEAATATYDISEYFEGFYDNFLQNKYNPLTFNAIYDDPVPLLEDLADHALDHVENINEALEFGTVDMAPPSNRDLYLDFVIIFSKIQAGMQHTLFSVFFQYQANQNRFILYK